ncbi:MAG TPA: CD225/dispanin family protein [Pyrinomonadaceae bacterium]
MAQQWMPPPPPIDAPANVPNYLVPAILATLFCCLPVGIVSIVFATQVNSKVAAGDMQGAMAASKSAKLWLIVSACLGLVGWIVVILANVLGLLAGIAGSR